MRPILTYLLAKKLNTIYSSTFQMLQIEISPSYSTIPIDIAVAKLRTCACFSVPSVPRVASTVV